MKTALWIIRILYALIFVVCLFFGLMGDVAFQILAVATILLYFQFEGSVSEEKTIQKGEDPFE